MTDEVPTGEMKRILLSLRKAAVMENVRGGMVAMTEYVLNLAMLCSAQVTDEPEKYVRTFPDGTNVTLRDIELIKESAAEVIALKAAHAYKEQEEIAKIAASGNALESNDSGEVTAYVPPLTAAAFSLAIRLVAEAPPE